MVKFGLNQRAKVACFLKGCANPMVHRHAKAGNDHREQEKCEKPKDGERNSGSEGDNQ